MITFNNWLNEVTDPLMAALAKIKNNQQNLPFDGNFTDSLVFQNRFGLDDNELQALKTNKILIRDEYGVNVDKKRFLQFVNWWH